MRNLILICLIFSCTSGYSLPVGNPASPNFFACCSSCCDDSKALPFSDDFFCGTFLEPIKLQVGYYGNFVNNRYMRKRFGTKENFHYFEVNTNGGYLAAVLANAIEFYTMFGASKIEFAANNRMLGDNEFASEGLVDTSSGFSWSIGGRAIVFQWGCLALGVQGEYFYAPLRYNRSMDFSSGSVRYLDDARTIYNEWQASIGMSYQYDLVCLPISLYPYAALTLSKAKLDSDDFTPPETIIPNPSLRFVDYETGRFVGYALGISFVCCNCFQLTAEGRFANEKAFSVLGSMRF